MGFPGGSENKESACNVGDLDSIPGLGRSSGGGLGNPLQYSSMEISLGQRSLVGYSSWGHNELDTTEQLNMAKILCALPVHFSLLPNVWQPLIF